jgi:hypothetical protein
LREATTAVEKEAKKIEKSKKSKAIIPPLLLTQTSIGFPVQNPCKWDASFTQLLVSRLQQSTSLALMNSARGSLHVQEFFSFGSLLTTDAYFMQHKAFPKEWVDMKAFLETVFLFSC